MLVGELECLNQSESLVDVSSDWQIVDGDLSEGLFAINDEQATEGQTFVLFQYTVVPEEF